MKKIVRSVSTVNCMVGFLGLFSTAGASDRGADIRQLAVLTVLSLIVFAISAVVLQVTK